MADIGTKELAKEAKIVQGEVKSVKSYKRSLMSITQGPRSRSAGVVKGKIAKKNITVE